MPELLPTIPPLQPQPMPEVQVQVHLFTQLRAVLPPDPTGQIIQPDPQVPPIAVSQVL